VGLKPGRTVAPGERWEPTRVTPDGIAHYKHLTMQVLVRLVQQSLDTPVVDATGVSGEYEMDLPVLSGDQPGDLESARHALKDFGLRLVPSRQSHEVFVLDNVK